MKDEVWPAVAEFGVPNNRHQFNSKELDVLLFTFLLARHRLLFLWKSNKPSDITLWLKNTMSCFKLGQSRHFLKGNSDGFLQLTQLTFIPYFLRSFHPSFLPLEFSVSLFLVVGNNMVLQS